MFVACWNYAACGHGSLARMDRQALQWELGWAVDVAQQTSFKIAYLVRWRHNLHGYITRCSQADKVAFLEALADSIAAAASGKDRREAELQLRLSLLHSGTKAKNKQGFASQAKAGRLLLENGEPSETAIQARWRWMTYFASIESAELLELAELAVSALDRQRARLCPPTVSAKNVATMHEVEGDFACLECQQCSGRGHHRSSCSQERCNGVCQACASFVYEFLHLLAGTSAMQRWSALGVL